MCNQLDKQLQLFKKSYIQDRKFPSPDHRKKKVRRLKKSGKLFFDQHSGRRRMSHVLPK